MTDEEPKTPEESKRLLKEMLKASGYSRASLVTALQEAQKEKSDTDNSIMMRDSRGRDIFYTIIEENPIKTFFQNIKKKMFELIKQW